MTEHSKPYATPASLDISKKWVVGVAVFKVDRLLVAKRVAHEESFAKCWEMPGGHVESSDANILQTVFRELKEETGLVGKKILKRIKDMTWVGGSGRESVQLNYIVDVEDSDQDILLCLEEHDDYTWATLEEVEQLVMTSEMKEVVRDAFAQLPTLMAASNL